MSACNSSGRAQQNNEIPGESVKWGASGNTGGTIPPCGLVISEIRHAPGRSIPRKEKCAGFYLMLTGHARWEWGGKRYLLGPETVGYMPAGQAYTQEGLPGEAALAYALYYQPELLPPAVNSRLAALGVAPLDLSSTSLNQARAVRALFQEMLFEQDSQQEGWEAVLQSRLIDLAVRVLRLARRRSRSEAPAFDPGSDSADRVARYVLRLKSQFFQHETSAEAARSVGLRRRQFAEVFRKVTGHSWRRYVLGLRLKRAAELLSSSDRSVSAVAFESGFDDLSNFHHAFKAAQGCSPLAYREQRRVCLPAKPGPGPASLAEDEVASGFRFRGIKGWSWTIEQYLEEIPVLPRLKLNFLMNCYRSMSVSRPGEPWCNEWWKGMTQARKAGYQRIIRGCREAGIHFCFAMHPQLDSPRPLDPGSPEDLELFFAHYAWAQSQGVRWFSICLDDASWGSAGPGGCGIAHATLVNNVLDRLQARDEGAQLILCPTAFWGDGTNPEHHAYLSALAQQMHAEVYVFWNGDSIITPRITRVAAESYKRVVQHRLFLWDNYPVNDGNPTLHLGPLSGREADLREVIDGYLSNPMCAQNQGSRLPLATCADYASNPQAYNPARSISQAILRLGKTSAQQQVLKDLVEAYPGFIVAGGGTGTNPVRAKFGSLPPDSGHQSAARQFIRRIEDIACRLARLFPAQFPATRKTVLDDVLWMKQQLARLR